jgi:hypothetical protein
MVKYELEKLHDFNNKQRNRFLKVYEKYKDYDKIDILIDLTNRRKLLIFGSKIEKSTQN